MTDIETLTDEYQEFLKKAAADFQATVESANAEFQQLLMKIPNTPQVPVKQPAAKWVDGQGLLLSKEAADQFMALFEMLGTVLQGLAGQNKV